MIPPFSLDKVYNKVLGRLARYKNMNPQLALNLVADSHFMTTMSLETDEEKIEEEIENKFVEMATQLQSEKVSLEKDIQSEKGEIQRLEEKICNIERTVEENKTEYQKQIEELEKNLENEKSKRMTVKEESENIKKKFKAFKTNLVRWAIFIGGLSLFSLFLWLHERWLDFPWLDTHKNKMSIEIALQLLLVFAFLNIILKRNWKTWLGFIVTITIAILGFACL